MKTKVKYKTIMDKEMANPEFKKLFEETWPAFQLEIQMLNALERKNWTYADLAKAMHTQKSAVSRDLKGGGLKTASMSRIAKMAEVLGMKFFPLCLTEEEAKKAVPTIKKLVNV